MNLAALREMALQLPERYEALFPARTGLIPEAVQALTKQAGILEISSLTERLKTHCDAQVKIMDEIATALSSRAPKFDHLIFFVTGSIAKLEYFEGASDVDLLAITTSGDHKSVAKELRRAPVGSPARINRRKASPYSRAPAKGLRKLHEQAVALQDSFDAFNRYWRRKVRGAEKVSGMPLCGGSYFYTADDLLKRVGKAHEPSWASIYRANLIFESAFFCGREHTERCTEMRNRSNNLYTITRGLIQDPNPVYPILGTLLLQILTRNGVLAKIAFLKDPKSHESEKVLKGVRQTELVKAIAGRLWSSVIHLIMLHVLFWEAVLKPPEKIEDYVRETHESLAEPPMYKLLSIADKMDDLAEVIMNRTDTNPDDSLGFLVADSHVMKTTEDHLMENYRYLGCHDARTDGKGVPLIDLYTCFMLSVGHIRKNAPALPPNLQRSIINSTHAIVDCIAKCEKLTLYLMSRVAKDTEEMSYLRYFGATIFDRDETVKFFKEIDERRSSNGKANESTTKTEAPAVSNH